MENKGEKKINIVSFHGLRSQGDNLEILVNRLEYDAGGIGIDVVTSQHDYPKLNVIRGMGRWERESVREFILKCLAIEFSDFPERELIVLCHSNATFGIYNALQKYKYEREKCRKIRVDKLILFGSTIPCHFNWNDFPDIEVVNFIGKKDRVVKFARLYGMGKSGRKGFDITTPNLTQIKTNWTHSQFVDDMSYGLIKNEVL